VADKPNEQASQRGRKNLIFFISQTTTAASLERSMVVHLIHITSCSSLIPFRPHKRVPEYIVSQNEVAKQHREIDLSMHPSLRNRTSLLSSDRRRPKGRRREKEQNSSLSSPLTSTQRNKKEV
jgi:hypothetical protein